MKNVSVAKKLMLGFLAITIICTYIGFTGVNAISQINEACSILYHEQTEPLADIAKTLEHVQLLRVLGRDAIILSGNTDKLVQIERDINKCISELDSYLDAYSVTIKDDQSRQYFDEASDMYQQSVKPAVLNVLKDAKLGVYPSILAEQMGSVKKETDIMLSNFTTCMNNKVTGGEIANKETDKLYITMLIKILVIITVSIIVSISLALIISRMISKPINLMSKFLHRFGSKGDYEMLPEDEVAYAKRGKDEIGVCQDSLYLVIQRLNGIGEVLQGVEHGDLTVHLDPLSEKDFMGTAITKVLQSLNKAMAELHFASSQVSVGSGQVARAAQELASGTSEQAATIEELTAALAELHNHTNHNAESATGAREASEKSMAQLSDSMNSMDEMMVAMNSIDESSNNITKVIKVIDDIAFQTNILALNAAVEAARAGQHGKGFAVVAEEVRDLASKSAAAAKETAVLIEGSGERVKEGNHIVAKTKSNLEMVREYSRELAHLVESVASETVEQAKTISEISDGLEQFSLVVQANSGTAEESAAASEEMSAQSLLLDDIVNRFKLQHSSSIVGTVN